MAKLHASMVYDTSLKVVAACRQYKYGWKTLIESDTLPAGLNEDVVRAISAKKNEPDWLLDFRLKAYRRWLTMVEPSWSDNRYPALDYQSISYYSAPKQQEKKQSLDELDPELLRTFERLNIPINEQKRIGNVAVDAIFDSTSIATTFRKELAEVGVIFCSISEAVRDHPELIKKHLGSVVCLLPPSSQLMRVVLPAALCGWLYQCSQVMFLLDQRLCLEEVAGVCQCSS